ncbi:MAG: transcription termination factor NusA [Thermodesulfobacteriota bacterium]
MISELQRIIDQISRDKGISRDLLVEALEEAVLLAAKKRFGQRREMEVQYNDELGEIELFQFRKVVDKVEDEQTEISLAEALTLDPEAILGDEIGSKMENVADLGRIAAQAAKQVIIQKMKDAECDVVFDMYKDRQGEIVNGIVQRFERGNIIVNLGRTDAILPQAEQMPRRMYRQGDRIRALLIEVRHSTRDPQLVLSRKSDLFLAKLFTMEVPEIQEGIVKIMGVSREPGFRAKFAVSSSELDVDPVGACVGMKGSRVQNVVQELNGERIDIVPWSPDPAKYISNALAPAQVSMVVVDEETKTLLVVVPDDQLSLAIGRGGQNVRLASQLLRWKIDVKSETRYARLMDENYRAMLELDGMTEKLADALFDGEITSVEALATTDTAAIAALKGFDDESAEMVTAAARRLTGLVPPAPAVVDDQPGEEAGEQPTDEPEPAVAGTGEGPEDEG